MKLCECDVNVMVFRQYRVGIETGRWWSTSVVELVSTGVGAESTTVNRDCRDTITGSLAGTCSATMVSSQGPLVALSMARPLPTTKASPSPSSVVRPKSSSDSLDLLDGRYTGFSRTPSGELGDRPTLALVWLRVSMCQTNSTCP